MGEIENKNSIKLITGRRLKNVWYRSFSE